jgi:hypothetical protein
VGEPGDFTRVLRRRGIVHQDVCAFSGDVPSSGSRFLQQRRGKQKAGPGWTVANSRSRVLGARSRGGLSLPVTLIADNQDWRDIG